VSIAAFYTAISTAVPASCTSCVVANCCPEGDICDGDTLCIQSAQCSAACAAGGNLQSCYTSCISTYGSGPTTESDNLLICVANNCTTCP
jgi:hypothetical protein